jgi:hypothetical protein|tara:strand:- start:371 stop:775 length:405 start_codon:yes stop_codon:yes gene_type:complete
MAGFGNAKEGWAERSLEKTSRELKALRNVIEKYKDDPKGRKKMMKKMKKYWRSNLAEVHGMDNKPAKTQAMGGGFVPVGMVEDLEAVQKLIAPETVPEEEVKSEDNLSTGQMSEIRDMLSKSKGEDHDQPSSEV